MAKTPRLFRTLRVHEERHHRAIAGVLCHVSHKEGAIGWSQGSREALSPEAALGLEHGVRALECGVGGHASITDFHGP